MMRMDMARTHRALETPPPSLPCDQCLCPHPWGKAGMGIP